VHVEIIGGEGRSTWSEVQYVMLGRKEDVERSWLKEGARGGRGEKLAKGRSTWRVAVWKEKRYVERRSVRKRSTWRVVA
jgi:hypothetical protein